MRTIPLALLAALAACSGSSADGPPADVAGSYTLAVTDDQNGCNVQNFETNATQTGIGLTIAQDGSSLTATGTSYQGLVLAFAAGNTLSGTISGSAASLSSSTDRTQGNCAYTTSVTANLNFLGNQVQGTMLYTSTGNGSSDCGVLDQCTSTQKFTGSR